MVMVKMTRGLYIHTDNSCWKEVSISEVHSGDIVSICESYSMFSAWPDLQIESNYQYTALVTSNTICMTKNGIKSSVIIPLSKFPQTLKIYKLMDIIKYDPNQEPEDDCL